MPSIAPLTVTCGLMAAVCANAAGAAPAVLADIAPVHSLVARVMEGVAEPRLLVPPGVSEHQLSLSPSQSAALADAGVVFWVGDALEPWLAKPLSTLAPDAVTVALLGSAGTQTLPNREGARFEAHEHADHEGEAGTGAAAAGPGGPDKAVPAEAAIAGAGAAGPGEPADAHAGDDELAGEPADAHAGHDGAAGEPAHAGDDDEPDDRAGAGGHAHAGHGVDAHAEHGVDAHAGHGVDAHAGHGVDAHAWLDPDNAQAWLGTIADTLASADPANAATYHRNAEAGRAEIAALSQTLAAELQPVRGVPFVVFHDAYQYFETHFDVTAAGSISLGDGSAPGPGRLAQIRQTAIDLDIRCALSEPQYDTRLIATVFQGLPVRTGTLDPIGATATPGPKLYRQVLRGIAQSLTACAG